MLATRILAVGLLTALVGISPSAMAAPPTDGPPGNNGTVKIAGEGDIDAIPDNEPHPGCVFTVQWYGFDKGPDVVSRVSFDLKPPTNGPGESLTVSGPSSVFVGADSAGGAGNDPDGEQSYVLTFTGTPAKQGFHVKLTVNTPRSNGSDQKTKVFWVEACGTGSATTPTSPTVGGPGTPKTPGAQSAPTAQQNNPTVLGVEESRAATALPTAVDAGATAAEGRGGNALLVALGLGLLFLAGLLLLVPRSRGRHQV